MFRQWRHIQVVQDRVRDPGVALTMIFGNENFNKRSDVIPSNTEITNILFIVLSRLILEPTIDMINEYFK
jgi:hypothetical protein